MLRFAESPAIGFARACLDAFIASRKTDIPRCEDCYFRKKMLCALDLEEPCVTFRPSRPEGLVPPKQPVLLLRPPRWASDRRFAAAERQEPARTAELTSI
jgi:hypothetical protein